MYSRDPLPLGAAPPERSAVCLQSRRIEKVTKNGIKTAVSDFLKGAWAPSTRKFIYATSASGVATQLTDEMEARAFQLAKSEIEFVLWDEEELSHLLRDAPELVDDFFGRPWVEAFFGTEVAEGLGRRLDGQQVARLRAQVRKTYAAAFGLADPGVVVPTSTSSAAVPLSERFVTPDLHPLRPADAYPMESVSAASLDPNRLTSSREDAAGAQRDTTSRFGDPGRGGRGSLEGDWLGITNSFGTAGEGARSGTTLADAWLGSAQRQVVIGDPGAGKSTLLRHLVLDLLSDEPAWSAVAERWGDRLPIWLPFHFFTQRVAGTSGNEASLVQAIKAWVEQHDIGDAWPLIQQALDDNRLLLVVDGLDEWSDVEAGEYAAAALQTFAAARSIALVVSSRPYGLQRLKLGPGWSYVRIASLSPMQQRSLARTYLDRGLEESARNPEAVDAALMAFMSEIDASADLRAMAGVPLFLILLVSIRLATGARLPNRRFELFERAIQLLIAEHPARRRVAAAITASRQGLKDRQLRTVLGEVAFEAQTRGDVGSISEDHLHDDLVAVLRDADVLALDQAAAIQQADLLAEVAEGELGLLVRQGPKEVAFIHRCLQEQLAAGHIATRMSKEDQHQLLLDRLGDVRWREVLLGVMWLTARPDERRSLAAALIERVEDTPVGLEAEDALAEIVFGPYDLPGAMSRDQARFLIGRIEDHPLLSHRTRLLSHFATGIDNVVLEDLVQGQLFAWTGLTEPVTGALLTQLGQAPTEVAAETGPGPAIVDALIHLDPEVAWAAAQVLVKRLSGESADSDEMSLVRAGIERVLTSPPSAASAAAALAVLCATWPDDAMTVRAVESYRSSSSGTVRLVALAHLLGVLPAGLSHESPHVAPSTHRLAEEDRIWLHEQISHRSDRGTHAGIERVTVDAAARESAETLEHVIERMKEGSGPDLDSVWDVALSAYADEVRVAELVAEQIADQHRPWPLLRMWMGSKRLASAYGSTSPHRELVASAIEAHIERFDTAHREMELHGLAAIDQGPRIRSALLRALSESSVPHWPASALLDHFAQDGEVMAALREALTSDPVKTARLGSFAGPVLGHERGRQRLLEVLRELAESPGLQTQARYDAIASGLIDCCQDITDPEAREEVCAEALALIPPRLGPWDGDTSFYLAVHFSSCYSAREILHNRFATAGARELPGLLFAFRDDSAINRQLIVRARQLLRTPPPSIRHEIYQFLATEMALPELAITCCESWAEEDSEAVKSAASLAYHRALLSERSRGNVSEEDWGAALARLGDVAASYGPDHEAKRRAAWVGMCVIGDWSPVDSRNETIGDPLPVGVELSDVLRGPDEILLDQLGRRWADLVEHFGAQLVPRLSGIRGENSPASTWGHLATVASRFAALDADLRGAVETDPQLLTEEGILTWYVSDQRRSRAAATELVGGHVKVESNYRGVAVRLAQDAHAFGLEVPQLVKLMEAQAQVPTAWPGNAHLEVLAVLQPSHPVVQQAWEVVCQVIGYGSSADTSPVGDDRQKSGGEHPEQSYNFVAGTLQVHTYLAIAYACIPSEDVGWLVARDLHWMTRHGDELSHFEPALVQHLNRRLRADPAARESVHAAAMRDDMALPVTVQILSLLAATSTSGSPLLESITRCLARVADDPFTPLTRDIVLGATVSVKTSLLNSAGSILR